MEEQRQELGLGRVRRYVSGGSQRTDVSADVCKPSAPGCKSHCPSCPLEVFILFKPTASPLGACCGIRYIKHQDVISLFPFQRAYHLMRTIFVISSPSHCSSRKYSLYRVGKLQSLLVNNWRNEAFYIQISFTKMQPLSGKAAWKGLGSSNYGNLLTAKFYT